MSVGLDRVVNDLPGTTVREKITTLEVAMSKCKQVEITPIHRFANGMYAREILVPKGVLISGKVHSTETVSVMSKGSMMIVNEDGSKVEVHAPYTHIGKVGWKRVGLALEDTVWVTIHRTDLTDLDAIEEEQFIMVEGGVDMFDFATGKVRDTALQEIKTQETLVVGV